MHPCPEHRVAIRRTVVFYIPGLPTHLVQELKVGTVDASLFHVFSSHHSKVIHPIKHVENNKGKREHNTRYIIHHEGPVARPHGETKLARVGPVLVRSFPVGI